MSPEGHPNSTTRQRRTQSLRNFPLNTKFKVPDSSRIGLPSFAEKYNRENRRNWWNEHFNVDKCCIIGIQSIHVRPTLVYLYIGVAKFGKCSWNRVESKILKTHQNTAKNLRTICNMILKFRIRCRWRWGVISTWNPMRDTDILRASPTVVVQVHVGSRDHQSCVLLPRLTCHQCSHEIQTELDNFVVEGWS